MSQLRETVIPVVVIVLVLGAGWYFREPIEKQFGKSAQRTMASLPGAAKAWGGASGPAGQPGQESASSGLVDNSAPPPALHKDTVYRWVDSHGVVHYEQHEGNGREAVVVDQSHTQSLSKYKGPVGSPSH
jgi:hypothetical protein